MTLVEVMAAVLLLGSAVTGILVAQARSLRQIRSAGLQMTASHLAEELIVNWQIEGLDMTAPASGTIPRDERWSWNRTSQRRSITETASVAEVVLVLAFRGEERFAETTRHEYRWFTHETTK